MVTHANCLHSGEQLAKHLAMRPDDVALTALPIFNVNAQCLTALSALTAGGVIVLLETYSASEFWGQVRRHRATCLSLVPAMPDERDHIVRAIFFAINVSDAEKDAFEERFGVTLINGYGLSEAMVVATMAPIHGERRWPSIGLPTYDHEIRIVDDQGQELPRGKIGEIAVGGSNWGA